MIVCTELDSLSDASFHEPHKLEKEKIPELEVSKKMRSQHHEITHLDTLEFKPI